MANEKIADRLLGQVMKLAFSGSQKITLNLDDLKLKVPAFDEPIKLSGKVSIEIAAVKSKK